MFGCEWGKDRRDIPDGNLSRKIESFMNMAGEIGGRGGKGGMVHGVRSLGRLVLCICLYPLQMTVTGLYNIKCLVTAWVVIRAMKKHFELIVN